MQYKIQVNDFERDGNYLKGLVSVTFDNAIKVTGIKIGLGKEDSLFIGMPNYKTKDEQYKDICHPVNKEFRAELYRHILDTFDNMHDGKGNVLTYNVDSKEKIEPIVRVTPITTGNNSVKGLATLVLNDQFALNNITIKEVKGKMYVDFPAYRTNRITEDHRQVFQNFFYPVTKEWQYKLKTMILEEYKKALDKGKEAPALAGEKEKKPEVKKKSGRGRV